MDDTQDRKLNILRLLAAAFFIAAGVAHFLKPAIYRKIVPPGFPNPRLLVEISGACEIAGGIGLLIRPLRPAAGWGLIALLIAVFPANIYMVVRPEKVPLAIPNWLLWARLPLQAVMVAWVWAVSSPENSGLTAQTRSSRRIQEKIKV